MNEEQQQRIQEIEGRLKAATPGNWFWDKDLNLLRTDKPPFEAYPNEVEIIDAWVEVGSTDPEPAEIDIRPTDAALIAHAPADLRFLIAEVERLQKYERAYIELTRELASPLASVEFLRRTNARLHEEGVSPDGATWGSDSGKAQA